MPGVIEGRDEFDDIDCVWPLRAVARVNAIDHPYLQPFVVRHPETEEEIRVTCKKIETHPKTDVPYYMKFQRYIVGRPNLLQVPIQAVQYEKSLHFVAGADFQIRQDSLWVWVFTEDFPPIIEVDCSFLTPNMPVKIGDIEKMLPYGMYLHKMYNH